MFDKQHSHEDLFVYLHFDNIKNEKELTWSFVSQDAKTMLITKSTAACR